MTTSLTMAGPLVVEESAKITAPDPVYNEYQNEWPYDAAIDGNWLIATGHRDVDGGGITREYSAWLYRRQSAGTWRLVRPLVKVVLQDDTEEPKMIVDMHDGVAAITKEGQGWVFVRSGNDWIEEPAAISGNGADVEVDSGTVAVSAGHCQWKIHAYRKAADGVWQIARETPGEGLQECENEDNRGDVAISGNRMIVSTFGVEYDGSAGMDSARIFEGPFGGPATMTRLTSPTGSRIGFANPVALENDTALVGDRRERELYAFTRDSAGNWPLTGKLVRHDVFAAGLSGLADLRDGFAVVGDAVFSRNANGTFDYVAKLTTSDGLGAERTKISGRRIVGVNAGARAMYVFDLPTDLTQAPTLVDDFEDGDASDWMPAAGSNFSVVTTSTSKVFRQRSVAGDAGATLRNTDRHHQAIQADITPLSFATGSGSRWFGLAARYTDANNYYYITLRNSRVIELKKIENGAFSTLASAPLPIALNRAYRVRLEAIGTRLRAFVDDEQLVEAIDTTHSHGQVGVLMYKTSADYDNIVVSANLHTPLFVSDGDWTPPEEDALGDWGWAIIDNQTNPIVVQSSVAGDARAITGIDTGDQIVQLRVRRTDFAGSQNWFGLVARYRDSGNYYYVTLRGNNVISLRKLVNGVIVQLDSAPLALSSATWYDVRLEAIGNQVRAYVNNELKVEATDSTHATGRYGPAMYKTAVDIDDILVTEP